MLKRIVSVLIFFNVLCLIACKNNTIEIAKKIEQDTTIFYPLQAYFMQQVKDVNNNADSIYIMKISNGKKDSAQINKATFDTLALQFTDVLTFLFNNTNYKESVFHDESTNSNTISYTALSKSLPVQNINILLDPVDQQVKRIFFSKYLQTNDTNMMQNFGWKNDNSFYVNTSVSIKDTIKKEEQLMVAWKKKK